MKRGWILVFSVIAEALVFYLPYSLISSFSGFLGTITGLTGLIIVGFLLIYFWWAPSNLFFTFVAEGRAKIVVRGDAFERVLLQWQGRTLAPTRADGVDLWDIVEGTGRRGLFGGLRFYGLWPLYDIYLYDFAWTGIAENGEVEAHPKEKLDYILVKTDVYLARVLQGEDKNLLPLDVDLVLTIRIKNPYKALFWVQAWLETVLNRTEPGVRDRITEDTFERWIGEEVDLADRIRQDLGTKGLLGEFLREYGVEVIAIEVRSINPPEDYRKDTIKLFLAQKERDRIVTLADAEEKRIAAVYGAIQKHGDLGRLVRVLEALEVSPKEGAKWVLLPGLLDPIARALVGVARGGGSEEDGAPGQEEG